MDDDISGRGNFIRSLNKDSDVRVVKLTEQPHTVCVETKLSGDLKWRPIATRAIWA